MKLQVQTALAALVLGMCSTMVLADPDVSTQSFGGGGDHKPGKHGCGTKCDGDIDIELYVPKHCDLDILGEKITMQKKGQIYEGASAFEVSANAKYKLAITAPTKLSNSGHDIGVNVVTKLPGGSAYTGQELSYQAGKRKFDVIAQTTNNFNPYTTYAGMYTGTYHVAVDF